jgi:ankyrin repeat protein
MATALMLIDQGGSLKEKETSGATPLHSACFNGHTATALMLIEHGASVAEKDNKGNTPLMIACQEGHFCAALMLIEQGSNLTDTDDYYPGVMVIVLLIWLFVMAIRI